MQGGGRDGKLEIWIRNRSESVTITWSVFAFLLRCLQSHVYNFIPLVKMCVTRVWWCVNQTPDNCDSADNYLCRAIGHHGINNQLSSTATTPPGPGLNEKN